MNSHKKQRQHHAPAKSLHLSDEDLNEALREMKTYVDITEEDLKQVLIFAFRHVHRKLTIAHRHGVPPSPPAVTTVEVLWSGLGAIIGIGLCAWLSARYFEPRDLSLLIGSFGASAVLLFAAGKSPMSQPRNLLGGHIISALVGVACYQVWGALPWLAATLAVAGAIMAMLVTRTLHPPGGATALIAVIRGPQFHSLGFLYALVPVGTGALLLLLVALVVNNLARHRHYPEYWW